MTRGLFTFTLLLPIAVFAQGANPEFTVTTQPATQPAGTALEAAPANLASPAQANGSGIQFQSNVYQTQPTTIVEDSPVGESKADAMRRRRQSLEEQTELSIVEKLESERVKAEQRRAAKIAKQLSEDDEVAAPVAATATASVQAPIQVVAPVTAAASVEPVVAQASVTTSIDEGDIEPKKEQSKFFIGGFGGIGDYPSATNVHGIYGAGVTAGMILPERLILELGFMYSSYDVQKPTNYYSYQAMYPLITQLDQMNITAGLKYQLLATRVRPVLGALASYTRRTYTEKSLYGNTYSNTKNSPTSQAMDMGVTGGVDVVVSESFTVGVDMRYFFNLTYRTDSPYAYSFNYPYQAGEPVEKVSYYMFGVNGKLTF